MTALDDRRFDHDRAYDEWRDMQTEMAYYEAKTAERWPCKRCHQYLCFCTVDELDAYQSEAERQADRIAGRGDEFDPPGVFVPPVTGEHGW